MTVATEAAPLAPYAPAAPASFPRFGRVVVLAYVILLAGNALEAYAVASIPVDWLMQGAAIGMVMLLGLVDRLYVLPGSRLLLALFAWAAVVTVVQSLTYPYANLMPQLATLPYPLFVVMRFVTFLTFLAGAFLVYWLLVHGYRDRIVHWTVLLGTIVAVIALYIYVAQLSGLPEPPRTRMGTTGGEQATVFHYAFHRAMGTFREPSHLAEWLILPFFLSFVHRSRYHLQTVLIGAAILLTGSLTGIFGVVLGIGGALLLSRPLTSRSLMMALRLGVVLALALVMFNWLAFSYSGGQANLVEVVWNRVEPMLTGGGMRSSNRDVTFQFMDHVAPPLLGFGLGNANLILSEYYGLPITSSFLSLYLNILYSAGIAGLALLLVFLARPLWRYVKSRELKDDPYVLQVVAAYIGFLVVFAVHLEALNWMFAIVLAMLCYETRVRRHEEPAYGA